MSADPPRDAVLQVVGDGRPGGGTTAVMTIARGLRERGIDVALVTQSDSWLAGAGAALGLTVHPLDFTSRGGTPRIAAALRRLLRDGGARVVHAHGARAGLPAALAMGPPRPKARFVYTVHGFHFVAKPPLVRRLARAAEALCLRSADATTFVSEGDRRVAREHGLSPRAGALIPNAVSVDPALLREPRGDAIGFLGRLTEQKNPLLLVDVLRRLPPTSRLEVIGGGELHEALHARAGAAGLGDRLAIHGALARDDALRRAARCALLLLPSRWEGHPIALLEAMQLGLPVVASDVPGIDEIVVHGETGFLVAEGDAAGFAEAAARLLADPALRERMGSHARRLAARHSPDAMLDAYLAVYGLDGGRTGPGERRPADGARA
ncbi:MAG TPA: glycosyltransferase [Burkholderiaceae bacterium]|nr:glycosyltransferase [Burkholderiaceae bacterium]